MFGLEIQKCLQKSKSYGSGGIRTHASEETGALNQRLRPLGHATHTLTKEIVEQFTNTTLFNEKINLNQIAGVGAVKEIFEMISFGYHLIWIFLTPEVVTGHYT
jgi:hypothetical protein